MPKKIIRFLQSLCIVRCANEELTAIGVGARVSHGETTGSVICQYRLIFEFVARTARTGTLWVTRLNNEPWHDTVEFHPIIKMVLCQEDKVIDSARCQQRVKLQYDQASIGIDTRTINLLGIDWHSRSLAISMRNLSEVGSTRSGRAIREFTHNR